MKKVYYFASDTDVGFDVEIFESKDGLQLQKKRIIEDSLSPAKDRSDAEHTVVGFLAANMVDRAWNYWETHVKPADFYYYIGEKAVRS